MRRVFLLSILFTLIFVNHICFAKSPYPCIIKEGFIAAPFTYSFEDKALLSCMNTKSQSNDGVIITSSTFGAYQGTKALCMGMNGLQANNKNIFEIQVLIEEQNNYDLSFAWMDLGDETHEADGVFISNNNGKTFEKIFSFNAENIQDFEWNYTNINLAAFATTPNIILRWVQYDNAPAGSDGIAIDLVEVSPSSVVWQCNFDAQQDKYSIANSGNSKIEVIEDNTNESPFLYMGHNSISKENYLNIFEITLNRLELPSKLHFDWNDYQEETHKEDGVFISSDNGLTFEKILDFDASTNEDFMWSHATATLPKSDSKIIIQIREFDNCPEPNDGIGIDNVMIKSSQKESFLALTNAKKATFDYQLINKNLQIRKLSKETEILIVKDANNEEIFTEKLTEETTQIALPKKTHFPIQISTVNAHDTYSLSTNVSSDNGMALNK